MDFIVAAVDAITKQTTGRFGEKLADRVARLSAVFSSLLPLTFVGGLAGKSAVAYSQGETINLPDGQSFSVSNPRVLRCVCCDDYHGAPRKEEKVPRVDLLPQNALFKDKGGRYLFLSQTCIGKYVLPLARKHGQGDVRKVITGLDLFAKWYPDNPLSAEYQKLEKPLVKKATTLAK